MIERIESPAPAELEALTDLWERSVRATHDFLAPEDIAFFRRMVREEALPGVEELHVIRDEKNGFAAFAGVEAGKLEMLFVAPEKRGKGLGRELVEYPAAAYGAWMSTSRTRRPRDSMPGWVSASFRAARRTPRAAPTPFSTCRFKPGSAPSRTSARGRRRPAPVRCRRSSKAPT